MQKKQRLSLLLGAGTLLALSVSAASAETINTQPLQRAVTVEGISKHLQALQSIANKNHGDRAAGSSGYKASVGYVRGEMESYGYKVDVQPFDVVLFKEKSDPVMDRLSPSPLTYTPVDDFLTMEYSGSGNESTDLALAGGIQVPPPSTPSSTSSGCAKKDFGASTKGKIVLVQRGTCDFAVKAANAASAGAVGVIIFNEGQKGRTEVLDGTLGGEATIPVLGTSYKIGKDLYERAQKDTVRMRVAVNASVATVKTWNVIGEVAGTVKNRTVVVGAHLDSVYEGPGINDNGSGSATNLEIARQMAKLKIKPTNTVRFAFWGAEEEGLFGSTHYVETLFAKEKKQIAMNLNFDMLGSPNYVRFVYDGSGKIGPKGPPGSGKIEAVFTDYFKSKDLATEPTAFDGRSDYFAFIEAGIPAGGLFSGAEELKTAKQAKIFGGKAGKPLDPCYHQACDTIKNINRKALGELGKGAAHAVMTFAMTQKDYRPASDAEIAEAAAAAETLAATALYRGGHLVR